MIKDFRHTCIVIKNLKRSLKFYRDILGLKVEKILNVEGKYPETVLGIKKVKLSYVKMKGCNFPFLELHCWKNPKILPKPSYNHISFTVKDLDYEYKRLKRLGVKFISKPTKTPYADTKVCFCCDPDNNLIEFIEDLKSK